MVHVDVNVLWEKTLWLIFERALDESDLLVCEASTLWYTPQSIAVCQAI